MVPSDRHTGHLADHGLGKEVAVGPGGVDQGRCRIDNQPKLIFQPLTSSDILQVVIEVALLVQPECLYSKGKEI